MSKTTLEISSPFKDAKYARSGYNPYDQIKAYLLTGDAKYITREGKAREYIQRLDKEDIKRYIRELCR